MAARLCRFESCFGHNNFQVMEIGSFSKYIKDLIVDYDKVEVPGLGIFYAKMMPARYSDNRTTIYPPYRTMVFRREDTTSEGALMLYESISDTMIIPLDQAETELKWCISRLRSELEGNKICILPGLGRMVANTSNDYFFVPAEDLDIYPDGLGFEPVCIKINDEQKKDRRHSRRKSAPQESVALKEDSNASKTAPATEGRLMKESRPVRKKAGAGKITLIVLLDILILATLFLLALYLFREAFSPFSDNVIEGIDDVLNRILYTAEERELLGF